jgi:hypothetical protein
MRIGRAAVPSGSAARTNTPHAKTEYRDAVSTYLPSTITLAVNREAI